MTGQIFSIVSLLWVILSLAFGDQFAEFRNKFSDKPVHTERQLLQKRHQGTIDLIKKIIADSQSVKEAQSTLKEIKWSEKVLVLFAQSENDVFTEIYSGGIWTGTTSFSKRGAGYGALIMNTGRHDYVILEGSATTARKTIMTFTLYIECERAN